MTTLLLTSLSPFAAWLLWGGLTLGVAWLMVKGCAVVDRLSAPWLH